MTPPNALASRRLLIRLRTLIGIFIACRLLLLVLAPHQDPSEARYAEISRKMVETGNWITPQHFYGVPFWAKPPLSMWMSAAGMELFGVNEFGSRIFIFIAALGVLYLVARFAWQEWSPVAGLAAAVMMMAMPLFFYCSAAVMTDLALAVGTTLTMLAFWLAVNHGSRLWGYLFFTGLAIGLLAKGHRSIRHIANRTDQEFHRIRRHHKISSLKKILLKTICLILIQPSDVHPPNDQVAIQDEVVDLQKEEKAVREIQQKSLHGQLINS